jgi:imidazolonepropionase-like amidohydrolase
MLHFTVILRQHDAQRVYVSLLCYLIIGNRSGCEVEDERVPEQETLVVRGKMLIDGTGEPPASPGLVAIAGNRVVYAGLQQDAPEFSPEAKVLDMGQAYLLTGLIDAHVHASYYYEESNAKIFTRDSEGALVYSEAMIALLAAKRMREILLSGVTKVRDVGGVNEIMFDVWRAIDRCC